MENATKALLIAGGILISMLVLTIGIYLFVSFRDAGSSYEQTMETTEIQKFNVNFTKFEGRKDITIQEIVSIVNFAKQYKEQTDIDILIYLSNENLMKKSSVDIIDMMKNEPANKYYKCGLNPLIKDIEYDENGMVKIIKFRE